MKRDYVAVFVGVSAWPIVSMIEAMARLAK
jgi:hypothetical protein